MGSRVEYFAEFGCRLSVVSHKPWFRVGPGIDRKRCRVSTFLWTKKTHPRKLQGENRNGKRESD